MPLTPTEKVRIRTHLDANEGVRLCCGCVKLKPFEDFGTRVDVRGERVPLSRCKECESGRRLEYRLADLEKFAAAARVYRKRTPEKTARLNRNWRARHPDTDKVQYALKRARPESVEAMRAANRRYKARLRAAGAGLTVAEVDALLAWPCFYCDAPSTELDHAVPVSRGGLHDKDNLLPACRSCNASKGDKLLKEWRVPCP